MRCSVHEDYRTHITTRLTPSLRQTLVAGGHTGVSTNPNHGPRTAPYPVHLRVSVSACTDIDSSRSSRCITIYRQRVTRRVIRHKTIVAHGGMRVRGLTCTDFRTTTKRACPSITGPALASCLQYHLTDYPQNLWPGCHLHRHRTLWPKLRRHFHICLHSFPCS